jgi:hypothetical protein
MKFHSEENIMSGDLITKITLSDGRRLDVNMPTMGDMETLFNGAAPTDNLPYLMCAKALGITIEEFRTFPMTDGLAIFNAISPALDGMNAYLSGVQIERDERERAKK